MKTVNRKFVLAVASFSLFLLYTRVENWFLVSFFPKGKILVEKFVTFLSFLFLIWFLFLLCIDIPHGFLHLFSQWVVCVPEICNFYLSIPFFFFITLKKNPLLLKCLFLLLSSDICNLLLSVLCVLRLFCWFFWVFFVLVPLLLEVECMSLFVYMHGFRCLFCTVKIERHKTRSW